VSPALDESPWARFAVVAVRAIVSALVEASTATLLAVGFLAGRTWWQRFALCRLAFGVWDVLRVVWLRVPSRRPVSLGERDLLLLIPDEWWGPGAADARLMRVHRRGQRDRRDDASCLRSQPRPWRGR
jgi:hypothetical protein